ncbi:class I SAM-dependent methyltransferase [Oryzobacter sp. R7]|uniref:class I SAM-dependent methyltransferase n=1 Tax=Oryzobacter faecalis TaxID=3388656 RepID=UPI00398CC8D7
MTTTETRLQQGTTTDPAPDDTADAAAENPTLDRLLQVMDDGALALLIGLGHETGLLEALADLPPATSRQVADAAGLDERYVREWLGGAACGELVEYDPGAGTYALCPQVRPFVTGNGPDNLARVMRYLGAIGAVAPRLVECFRHGGGLGYADYPDFHRLQAEESAAVNDASLVDTIIPLTGLVDRLVAGIDVLDVGCGRGHAVNILGRAFPRSRFTGYDFSADALVAARAEAAAWGLTNVTFEDHDVATLPEGAFDLVTAFDAVHDQAHPATVLAAVRRSLRDDGTFLMVDIKASSELEDNLELPWGTFLYWISTFHCMTVSLGQGGEGLGTVWGTQLAERMVRAAGFGDVTVNELADDPFNVYVVARP